jgi:hypothetical protein
MMKNIKIKLIHLLGGISQDEAKKFINNAFNDANMYNRNFIKCYFTSLEEKLYGKSKQEWIDMMHKAIKNL